MVDPLPRVVDLVNQLDAEKREGKAGRLTARLLYQDVIVLDELGYLSEEACPLALLDCMPGERGGQVRLAGTGAANEHDVAGGGEVFAGVELADLCLVHY